METNELTPEDAAKLSVVGKKYFHLIEFDKDEQLVAEIRKHPIGLFFIYLTGIGISLVMAILFGILGLSDFLATGLDGTGASSSSAQAIIILVGMLLIFGTLAVMTIQAILYTNNVIFVTSEKIAQILYINLFNKKISQLSIGDVQDVTVTQKGILAHIFNYGTLVIETAGEQQNYNFTYIPEPYKNSKLIVGAHERNLVQFGN
jgi:uncharacterized membrane protein YdbT with pleckstrin-like domain